jgi:FkbM family methyltransferase
MMVDSYMAKIPGFKPRVIVHVGANAGRETGRYEPFQPRQVILIEADANLVEQMKARMANEPTGTVDRICIEALITDQDGQDVIFNYFNNRGASSSIFRSTDLLRTKWPGVRETGETKVMTSTRLETALRRVALSPGELDVLVIDIQGAELLCLKGAGAYLDYVIFIEIEVSREEIYEGGVLFSEVDEFLRRAGFKRISEIPWHGDVVYIREAILDNEAFRHLRPLDAEGPGISPS